MTDTRRDIYSVSRLNREVRTLLEGAFPMLWVEGEVSNLSRPTSGHLYFSLKDELCQIRCALFRQHQRALPTSPRDGLQVIVRARVSLYEGRGDFQLIVDRLEEAGEGALRRAFELLRQRLAAEGLFAPEHKKVLPRLPKRIGIISSPSGAVLHDILMTLRRRFPAIPVLLYPVPVQGAGAAEEIARTIHLAAQRQECDALILARGGGSLEDLWAFNEEVVARAVYDCDIPVVSGVGHETDFTIADFVADVRAPTPTAAAELLSPDQNEWRGQFQKSELKLARLVQNTIIDRTQRLDWLLIRLVDPRKALAMMSQRVVHLVHRLRTAMYREKQHRLFALLALRQRLLRCSPVSRIHLRTAETGHFVARLRSAVTRRYQDQRSRLEHLAASLHTLSPLATLARGYSIIRMQGTGKILRSASDVTPGVRIDATLAHGHLSCVVEGTRETD